MRALTLLVLAVPALAGCLAADSGPAVVPPMDEAGRYVIHLTSDNRFEPDHALVPQGASVVWVVEGGVHDVTAANGSWSSNDEGGSLRHDDSFVRPFSAEGRHAYVCEAHEILGMRGLVEVRAAPSEYAGGSRPVEELDEGG